MATLVLDPASLQALRDLTDATKRATAAATAAAKVPPASAPHHGAGPSYPSTAPPPAYHPGYGLGGATPPGMMHSLHNLAMGQAMGQRLWLHPATGQMTWIPGGGAGGMGGGGGPPRGPGGGGAMLGAMRPAGMPGPIAGPLAAAMGVGHLGDSAASLASVIHDPYMGGAAGERKLFRDVVPFGGRIQGWVDAISGRDAQMVQARARAETMERRGGLEEAKLRFLGATAPGLAGASAYASSFLSQAAAAPPVLDRSTAAGEQQYRDAMKLLPLKQETLKAEREMKRAVAERSQAEVHANSVTRERVSVERQMAGARAEADRQKGHDSAAEQRSLLELAALAKQHDALRGIGEAAETNLYAKRQAEAGAVGTHKTAQLREQTLGRAEILQDQADRAKGTAVRLGGMNPLERAQALQAVKIGREHGIDALPPEMRQMFAQLAPKEFEAAAAKAGQGAEFRELQAMGVVDAPGGAKRLFGATVGKARGPAELQKEADTLRKEAAEGEFLNEASAARMAEGAGTRMGEAVTKALDAAIDRAKQYIDDKFRLSR